MGQAPWLLRGEEDKISCTKRLSEALNVYARTWEAPTVGVLQLSHDFPWNRYARMDEGLG